MRKLNTLFIIFVFAMCGIVAASNILVQFPVQAHFGGVNIGDILTWGAFTYPIAFLINDATNRKFGVSSARLVVFAGFILAVILSIWLASPRIAVASGTAFLCAQLLDISVFDRLRGSAWWKAPIFSTLFGSALDTALFFTLAFAPMAVFLDFGAEDGSLGFAVPFLGFGGDVPLWVSLAAGDFLVKIVVGLVMLLPYKILVVPAKAEPASA